VVFLHIGAMKTGTTYLQQLLIQNKDNLAAHGYLFPGAKWGEQVRAAHDAVGHHRDRGVRARAVGAWKRLADEMLTYDGKSSIFSVEFLGFAGPGAARRIVEDLSAAEVHVVLTVRDSCEVLPGLWQTHSCNGGTASWSAFARSARIGAGKGPVTPLLGQGARLFRRALDIPRMLDSWTPVVPPERLHVVTVPPPGSPPNLLWERFASVLGLDPAIATNPAKGHNPSLGYASADLIRRLNAELGRLPRETYNATLKHYLSEEVLAARAGKESRARLDTRTQEFALAWNRRTREALGASGVHLVGDLDDLPVTASTADLPDSIEPPARPDLLDATTTALEGMEWLVRRRTRRVRALGDEPPVQSVRPGRAATARVDWAAAPDPVEAAVQDLAEVSRLAIDLHDRIGHLRLTASGGGRPGRGTTAGRGRGRRMSASASG
jgi:hypothetical protein